MRACLAGLCLAVLLGGPVHAAGPQPVDVFLVAGQSNAQGAGDASQSPAIAVPGTVLQFFHDKIEPGGDPVGGASTGSAWPAFGNAYYAANKRRVLFVPVTLGSTAQQAAADFGYGNWDTGSPLLADSMTEVDVAMLALARAGYTPSFKGVLWCQGEADGQAIDVGKPNASVAGYEAALRRMIATYRAHFGATMPFYIFQTGTEVGYDDTPFAGIRAAQEDVAQSDPYSLVVFWGAYDFWWRLMMVSPVHYTQTAYNEMGGLGAGAVSFFRAHPASPKPPTALPDDGLFPNGTPVTLASAGSYWIAYTRDGAVPDCAASPRYAGPIAIEPGVPTHLQATGCRAGIASPVSSYSYNYVASFPAPQASPPPGPVKLGTSVTLLSPTATSFRYYWTGIAVPLTCTGGTVYTGPIALSQSHDNFTAVACNGPYASAPVSFGYTVTR